MPVSLQHPVERVEEPLAECEVRRVVQRLDIGHHALVCHRLGEVLLRDADIVLALDQVHDVNRRDLESLD